MSEMGERQKVSGNLNISADVLHTVICETIQSIDGISCLHPLKACWKDYLLHVRRPNSIRIEPSNGTVRVEVGIKVFMGISVEKLCESVQKQIKSAVQEMTRLTVSCVDVYVAGMDNSSACE